MTKFLRKVNKITTKYGKYVNSCNIFVLLLANLLALQFQRKISRKERKSRSKRTVKKKLATTTRKSYVPSVNNKN
jgi:hypothetical protein